MSSEQYKKLKKFILEIEKNNNFKYTYNRIGKKYLKDLKYDRIRRCKCRIFDFDKANINKQCYNPITTIDNKCYTCSKNNNDNGFVDIYPSQKIIDKYDMYSRKNKIIFKKSFIDIGKYRRYITNNFLKVKIIDYEEYTHIYLFLIPDLDNPSSGKLKDKYHNIIGFYKFWEDKYNCVPDEYKNENNIILDPVTFIPLFEYDLTKSTIYHDLTNKIYKKYAYDQSSQTFKITQNIVEL